MLMLDNMWQQELPAGNVPCVYCAPHDEASPVMVLEGLNGGISFAPIELAVYGIGGLGALVGLVASFTRYRTVAKVGAGIGVAGALAVLAFGMIRMADIHELAMTTPSTPAHGAAIDQQNARNFAGQLVAGGLLATSAVALLLAGRS